MMHPRDVFSNLEAIWMSFHSYLAKRLPLEQVMIDDCSVPELEATRLYLERMIELDAEALQRKRAIRSIIMEVLEDRAQRDTANQ